ncbi:MAG: D-TA family PLP-dependent enzyme [Bacteroidota bacterium]|nr:D-TA family PLP-dependent enzyme [Bacteroidota bacterium]
MNSEIDTWYKIENSKEIDSPAILIYLDRVKHNIDLAISMISDVSRLRPHVKTNKCKEVTLLMMEAGITKFKCATIAEAEMLGISKAKDVLLAYQTVGPKANRFISLIKKYPQTKFSCLIDNAKSAQDISKKAILNKLAVSVFIDLNVGQNRTGILPEKAVKLYKACKLLHGINIVGLHAYDGHIYDSDFEVRKQKADEVFKNVQNVKNQLSREGLANPIIVMGGSPNFPIYAKSDKIECSPGTFVYWDKGYSDSFPDMKFQPAALLLTRIISQLDNTTFCIDLGHKSVAPENNITHRVFFMQENVLKFISQNEEHLVVELKTPHSLKVGDVLYGMPVHICPTVALHERVFVVNNNRITNEWKTIARDRKINI